MSHISLFNRTRKTCLGARIVLADTWFARLRGYLFRRAPDRGEGLFIVPCRAVHMYGMRFALDVAFLDSTGRVVAIYPALRPRGRTAFHRSAVYAIELPVGTLEASGTRVGDQLAWTPTATAPPANASWNPQPAVHRRHSWRIGA